MLISLLEAQEKRITKVRQPIWANKDDHLELYITEDGRLGLWAKLWSPVNERIGAPNPQTVALFGPEWDMTKQEWEPYVEQVQT